MLTWEYSSVIRIAMFNQLRLTSRITTARSPLTLALLTQRCFASLKTIIEIDSASVFTPTSSRAVPDSLQRSDLVNDKKRKFREIFCPVHNPNGPLTVPVTERKLTNKEVRSINDRAVSFIELLIQPHVHSIIRAASTSHL